MKTAKQIYRKILRIYKGLIDFSDSISFLVLMIKIKGDVEKEEFMKVIREFKDLYEAGQNTYQLLEAIAWTGNGYNALKAFIKRKTLEGVPRILKSMVASLATKFIIDKIKGIIPDPKTKAIK